MNRPALTPTFFDWRNASDRYAKSVTSYRSCFAQSQQKVMDYSVFWTMYRYDGETFYRTGR